MRLAINWFKYSAPTTFYGLAGKLIPFFAWPAAILFAVGLYIGFFVAPTDAVQSEAYRIMFIHVPSWSLVVTELVNASLVYVNTVVVFTLVPSKL